MSHNVKCLICKHFSDPFVKVYLLSGGKRVKKKKTALRKSTTNPVWNEALTFNISSANLGHSAIEVLQHTFTV